MHKNPFIILLILSFSLILNIGNANAKQQPLRNINHQLAEDLGDHQSYADSDPGNYDYAKYIQRIYYLDRKTIIIQVKPGFQKMTIATRQASVIKPSLLPDQFSQMIVVIQKRSKLNAIRK